MNDVILYEMRKTKEEVFGKKIIEVAPEAYEHKGGLFVIETYRKIAAEGGSSNLGLVEYSNHMVAGTYECSVHHIQNNYVYVQLRNVTELEKTLKKNKELEEFNYITSHDLQEPLNTIIGYTGLLQNELDNLKDPVSEICIKSLDTIKSSAFRMKDFITDLLEYSKIRRNQEKTEVDITKVINEIKTDLNNLISSKKASVTYVGKPLKIMAFKIEFKRILQNLITNGIQFTNDDTLPKIIINVETQNNCYLFSVADNGIGIPKNKFEKIFEVFQRLHKRNKHSGTGIGLSYVKRAVEKHYGKIWLTSKKGKGSIFYFTISK